MKNLLLIYVLIFKLPIFAQGKKEMFISVNYSPFLSGQLFADEIQVGGGVHLNDHFAFQLALRGILDKRAKNFDSYPPDLYDRTSLLSLGLESSFRVLKEKMISPVLGINMGAFVYSNARDRFINSNFVIRKNYSTIYDIYDKGLFNLKAKALLDMKLRQFNLSFGPNYGLYYFRITLLEPVYYTPGVQYQTIGSYTVRMAVFGFEVSLNYTFPGGKNE